MIKKELPGKEIRIPEKAFIAENAVLAGDVTLGEGVSVWYGAVLRGDEDRITVGKNSNVQDNATVHTTRGFPVRIGEGVTVGHNAIVHGAEIGNNTMVGMGACVMNGAVIGEDCIIGAGALVKEKTVIPDRSLVVGVPARIVRELSPEQAETGKKNAAEYLSLAGTYLG